LFGFIQLRLFGVFSVSTSASGWHNDSMDQPGMKLSVCIITCDEEANIGRTLEGVSELVKQSHGEIIVLDSGSTDRTVEIAKSYGAEVFTESWKGFPAQKNSAIDKGRGDWIFLLDADEVPSKELASEVLTVVKENRNGPVGFWMPRKNLFLDRFLMHGGDYPDPKLRLFRRGAGRVEDRPVHETIHLEGETGMLTGELLHYGHPTLEGFIEHNNRYSSLGAQMAVKNGKRGFSFIDIVIRPNLTFIYNYVLRRGFLDGKAGLLHAMNHAFYVSWKYAKVWELTREANSSQTSSDAKKA
jgi:glycosyltransferase involved in cell wall biosynthesis